MVLFYPYPPHFVVSSSSKYNVLFQYFRYLKLRCFSRRCVRDGPLPPQPCAGRLLRKLPVLSHKRGGPKGALCVSIYCFYTKFSYSHYDDQMYFQHATPHQYYSISSHKKMMKMASDTILFLFLPQRLVSPLL